MTQRYLSVLALLVALAWPSLTYAQAAPNGFYVENVTADESLYLPTDIAMAPDGRMYVAHKLGWVSVVERDGTVRPERFLDLSDQTSPLADRGLLSITLHPDFPSEPYVYVYYSRLDETTADATTPFTFGRLERWTASGPDLAVADPDSRLILVGNDYSDAPVGCQKFHQGATVAFAPDGSLLLSTGDGAYAGDPDGGGQLPACFEPGRADPANDIGAFRSQRLGSLNGKVLRLDPETGLGLPDNPFYTGDPAEPESRVWALGLRNPFRMAVRPDTDGIEVAVGDVGWFTTEEINLAHGGENFGWPCFEGTVPGYWYGQSAPPGHECQFSADIYTDPSAEWSHSDPQESIPAGLTALSITGGTFYTGDAFPEAYHGALFLADFASEWLMSIQFEGSQARTAERVLEDVGAIVDLEMDRVDGSVVLLDILGGRILRLRNTGAGVQRPVARVTVSPFQGVAPLPVTFSSEESFDPAGGALTAEWAFGEGGATAQGPVVQHTYTEPGTYTATLTLTSESGISTQTTWRTVVGLGLPVVQIEPFEQAGISAGDIVALRASASDPLEEPEDLTIRWEARLVHNGHEHPAVYTAVGPVAMLPVSAHASSEELSYYNMTVTATDGEGLSDSETVFLPVIPPETVVSSVAPDRQGQTRFDFGREVTVRSVLVRDTTLQADEVGVQLRRDGVWTTPQFAQAVRVQRGTRVLFVEQSADAIRVLDGPVSPEVQIRLGAPGGLPAGLEAITLGASGSEAPAAPVGDSGLALGSRAASAFAYTALQPEVGIAADVLDVVGAGRAGVAMRATLGEDGASIVLARDDLGSITLRYVEGDEARVDTLTQIPGPVRLSLTRAEASIQRLGDGGGDPLVVALENGFEPSADLFAGVMVDGAQTAAWFDALDVAVVPAVTPPMPVGEALSILSVAPNPTTGTSTINVIAVHPGTYLVQVFDALGRTVLTQQSLVETPRQIEIPISLGQFGVGLFTVRIVHPSTGDSASVRVTRIR